MWTRTQAQDDAVTRLEAQGWRVTHEPGDGTVYLAKRGAHRGQTLYCQVDEDGTVN